MKRAWIGLGANLGDPPAQLRTALDLIAGLGELQAVSPFYRSAPMGPADQPDYCNAVCRLATALAPAQLMQQLLAIERRMGRVRSRKWGARTIDLDLLHVEGESCDTAELVLPHPGIAARNFVLVPLAELDPELVIPGLGRVVELSDRLGRADLAPW
ncbi:2-amino-4-hydroxy-6-hydroxymethyldihydropteridine diphosphokinase [Fontimonas sp. SYSU GA230001]|uniref:2-amino-4-hydroxy-6- hydroxymethyldihydropteridine diphosphokinase n=1 Tax=Fontimonas sp. SYSU GA230001 TaxID=3142450 RepID=UPI0032B58272